MLEIKEDIREECSKLGEVTNVVLFDKEEAGVASVRFSTTEAASACVRVSKCVDQWTQRLISDSSCMDDGSTNDN